MGITTRRAVVGDLDWLLSELEAFSRFFGSKHDLFEDSDYTRQAMIGMIENHLVVIAETEEAVPVGFIAGVIIQHFFNPRLKVLSETFWWVTESHRHSRAGLLLLREFVAWGESNCDWITFALETQSPVRDEALLKRGFKQIERNFLKEVS
jgi:hypothetical protein